MISCKQFTRTVLVRDRFAYNPNSLYLLWYFRTDAIKNNHWRTNKDNAYDPHVDLRVIYPDLLSVGAGEACWLERRTRRDRKVAKLNPGRSGGRIFFSRVNFVCWLLFGVRSTPLLPQWHVKDPSHSAKSAGGKLHLNTHTPLTQRSWSGRTMLQSRHSVGSYQETSSHATRKGTLGHSRFRSLSHCGGILV